MEVDLWLRFILILALLALSAVFSSMESAYFSLSRTVVEGLRESSDPRARRVARLMSKPHQILSTFLAGNTLVNTAAAAIAALTAVDVAQSLLIDPNLAVAVEVVLISILLLFFAELAPKLLSLRNPERWAVNGATTVQVFYYLLSPLALPLAAFTSKISSLFGIEKHSMAAMSEEEIRALVQVGHEKGSLELEERKMIHSIFDFGDTTVREVMVPRIDMVSVEKSESLDDLLNLVVTKGHSRIPVYDERIDNITGVIYAKDLLKVAQSSETFVLDKLARPPYFIPEEKKIDDLLREFQHEKIHIAIVVDEFGGTAGLVTLEDIIEEIVGEIQDEYDIEQPMSSRIDDDTLLANGRMMVDDFNEMIGYELLPDSEAFDTLAGFVYSHLGEVPTQMQEFQFEGYQFIVEQVDGKRIETVRVIKEGGIFDEASRS